ncbi:methyltransferase [Pseudonocardia pini]|uniref:methyltransferase n=1 Tax=Pseudonocardia pini TaxID=2758030 RepID=UPI0015F03BC1|nr:methyltransferase [Pseudonocardia pini]
MAAVETGERRRTPLALLRAARAARGGVQRLHRRMAPAPTAMLDMIGGHRTTQAIYVAARLGIADELAAGPLTPGEIARRVEADPDGVRRLLRALAGMEVFALRPDGRYELTPLADTLRSDHPRSTRSAALYWGSPPHWEHWGHLVDAVRRGRPVVPALRGTDVWSYLRSEPEFAAAFDEAKEGLADSAREAVVEAYDFTELHTVVDVGGGRGQLLTAILEVAPQARGVLFDQPSVVDGLGGLGERCAVEAGSYFDEVPEGADCYLLKNVLHDWTEQQALQILGTIRRAVAPTGRLLLVETVIPEGNVPHPGKLADLEMLLLVGGRERTERDYRALLAQAGFELVRTLPTASPLSILEAVPA